MSIASRLGEIFNVESGDARPLRRVGGLALVLGLAAIALNNYWMTDKTYPTSPLKLVMDATSNALVVISSSAFVASIRLNVTERHENKALLTEMENRFTILQEWNVAYVKVHDSLDFDYIHETVLTEGDTLRIMVTWQANWIQRDYFKKARARKKVDVEILMFAPESLTSPGAPNEFVTERQEEIGRKDDPTWGMEQIKSIQKELDHTIKSLNPTDQGGAVVYKFLHGSVRAPVYVIKRGEKVVRAFTGFYCNLSDENNLFLEWFLPSIPLSDEKTAKTAEFLKGLDEYFEMKWCQGKQPSVPTAIQSPPP